MSETGDPVIAEAEQLLKEPTLRGGCELPQTENEFRREVFDKMLLYATASRRGLHSANVQQQSLDHLGEIYAVLLKHRNDLLRSNRSLLDALSSSRREAQEEMLEGVIAHWFLQGGHAQYGPIAGDNEDAVVESILRVVRESEAKAEAALAASRRSQEERETEMEDLRRAGSGSGDTSVPRTAASSGVKPSLVQAMNVLREAVRQQSQNYVGDYCPICRVATTLFQHNQGCWLGLAESVVHLYDGAAPPLPQRATEKPPDWRYLTDGHDYSSTGKHDPNQCRFCLRTLVDALQCPEWRSMDTAPRDGSRVLLADDCGDGEALAVTGHYVDFEQHGGAPEGYHSGWYDDVHGRTEWFPVGWMPLPVAQVAKAREAGCADAVPTLADGETQSTLDSSQGDQIRPEEQKKTTEESPLRDGVPGRDPHI